MRDRKVSPKTQDPQQGSEQEESPDRLQLMRTVAHRKIHRAQTETVTQTETESSYEDFETDPEDQKLAEITQRLDVQMYSQAGLEDLKQLAQMAASGGVTLRAKVELDKRREQARADLDRVFQSHEKNPYKPMGEVEVLEGCGGILSATDDARNPFSADLQLALMDKRTTFMQGLSALSGQLGEAPMNQIEGLDRQFMQTYYHDALFGARGRLPMAPVKAAFEMVKTARTKVRKSWLEASPDSGAIQEQLDEVTFEMKLQEIRSVRNTLDLVSDVAFNALGNMISPGFGNLIGNKLQAMVMRGFDAKALQRELDVLEKAPESLAPDRIEKIKEDIATLQDLQEQFKQELEKGTLKTLLGDKAAIDEMGDRADKPGSAVGEAGIEARGMADKAEDKATRATIGAEIMGDQIGKGAGDTVLGWLATVGQASKWCVAADSVKQLHDLSSQKSDLEQGLEGKGDAFALRQNTTQDLQKMTGGNGVNYTRVSESNPEEFEVDVLLDATQAPPTA